MRKKQGCGPRQGGGTYVSDKRCIGMVNLDLITGTKKGYK